MSPRPPGLAEPRYEPLGPGGGGLPRQAVVADQRRRLEQAIVETVARRGYAAMTVDDVVALARVAKNVFYEHFSSKLDCVLRIHDQLVKDSGERVAAAYRSRKGWHERLHAAFAEFMAVIVSDPDAAWLVIVEALALADDATEHRERAARSFERLLRQSFDQAPGGAPVSDATLAALVGGMRRLVYIHLHEGTVAQLPGLARELADWATGYLLPADAETPAPPNPPQATPVPTVPVSERVPEPPDPRVRYTPRARIMLAVESLVAEHGYRALTLPAIAARAGSSNETLYRHFKSKQGAFMAVFDDGAQRALKATQAAFHQHREWPQAARSGIHALLTFLASEPNFARLAFVELRAAGQAAQERSELVLDWFTGFLTPGLALAPGISQTILKAISGGVWSIVHREVSHHRTARLPDLTPSIAYIVLTPFIGAQEAARIAGENVVGAARE